MTGFINFYLLVFPKDGREYFRDTLGSLSVHFRSLDARERGCSEGEPKVIPIFYGSSPELHWKLHLDRSSYSCLKHHEFRAKCTYLKYLTSLDSLNI